MKRLIHFVLALAIVLSCFAGMAMQVSAAGDDINFDDLLAAAGKDKETLEEGWNEIDGYKCYVVDGKPVTGWKSIDKIWYYFDKEGIMQTGLLVQGSATYYLDAEGKMLTGWQRVDGTWYFFDKASGAAKTGWYQEGSTWYYMTAEGKMVIGEYTIGTAVHKFNSSGAWLGQVQVAQKNGWKLEDGKWYFYVNNAKKTGWHQEGSVWYYLEPGTGAMVTGEYTIGTQVNKFNASGVWLGVVQTAKNGWIQENGKWYYYANGAVTKNWKQIGGVWYYFDASGVMVTGWKQIGGVWYFFNTSGAMKTGWLQQGSTWYYFHASGAMATGTVKIGSVTYKFAASGAWIP